MKQEQTALEFILSELDIAKLIEREKLTMAAEVVRQAREMEKSQISKAYETGWVNGDLKKAPRFGTEYYESKYQK
jgi:HEPN domain-containing protein